MYFISLKELFIKNRMVFMDDIKKLTNQFTARGQISFWDSLDVKSAVLLAAYNILISILFFKGFVGQASVAIVVFQFFFAVWNPFICLAGFISTSLFIHELLPNYLYVLLYLMMLFCFIIFQKKVFVGILMNKILFWGGGIVFCSYLIGDNPNINVAILMLLCMLSSVVLFNSNCQDALPIVVWGYFCAGFSISIYFLLNYFNNSVLLTYGRLNFGGDIKSVAVVCAIPAMILLLCRLDGKKVFLNLANPVAEYSLVAVFVLISVLTLARGVLFAMISSIVLFFFLTKNKRKTLVMLIFFFFLSLFISPLLDANSFSFGRLSNIEEYSNMNGRIGIWEYYFNCMLDGGVKTILIGVGPGEISRIGNIGYYAHSTFLDFFFSYGVLGFSLMLVCELFLLCIIAQRKNPVFISLFVMSILMYVGHGSSANNTMFVFQVVLTISSTLDTRFC